MVTSITKLTFLDPIIAIIIAIFILKEAWELITNDFSPLLDTKLLDEEIEKIETVLSDYKDVYFDYHELRTRRVGKTKHIDLHMTFCLDTTVKEAYDLCDKIELAVEEALKFTQTLIHT